jgi:hypothetical protein
LQRNNNLAGKIQREWTLLIISYSAVAKSNKVNEKCLFQEICIKNIAKQAEKHLYRFTTHLQVLHENELDNINNLETNYKTLKQLEFDSRNYQIFNKYFVVVLKMLKRFCFVCCNQRNESYND